MIESVVTGVVILAVVILFFSEQAIDIIEAFKGTKPQEKD